MTWRDDLRVTAAATTLIAIVVGLAAYTATAYAQPKPDMALKTFVEKRHGHFRGWKQARRDDCRTVYQKHLRTGSSHILPWERRSHLAKWRMRKWRAIRAPSRCLPTSNIGIIRYVFPDSTENAALNVAYCESAQVTGWARAHLAYNPASGVAGLFQIHPLWGLGQSAYDPWVNARFAARLSRGGTDWSHWACKPWDNPYGPEPF